MKLKKLLKLISENEYVVLRNKDSDILHSDYTQDLLCTKRLKKHRKLKVLRFYYLKDNLFVVVKL